MDFWKHYNARQLPRPSSSADHTRVVQPERPKEDAMVYRDRDGRLRVAILDHSRVT